MRHRKLGRLQAIRLVTDHLAYLEGRQPPPNLDRLPASKRHHATELLNLVTTHWGRDFPEHLYPDRIRARHAEATGRHAWVPPKVAAALLVGTLIVGVLVVALYVIGSTAP